MKIALCFGGHVRTAQYAVDNLKRFIGDLLPNTDIFCHTWRDNEYKSRNRSSPGMIATAQQLGKTIEELSRRDKIFRPIDPPDTLVSLSELEEKLEHRFKIIQVERFYKEFLNYKNTKPRFYSWHKVNELCNEYQSLPGIQYDYVIKLRFDMVLPETASLKKEIDHYEKARSKLNSPCFTFINDLLLLSDPAGINIMVDNVINNRDYTQGITRIRALSGDEFAIYRPESIPKSSLNFNDIRADDLNWYWPPT